MRGWRGGRARPGRGWQRPHHRGATRAERPPREIEVPGPRRGEEGAASLLLPWLGGRGRREEKEGAARPSAGRRKPPGIAAPGEKRGSERRCPALSGRLSTAAFRELEVQIAE